MSKEFKEMRSQLDKVTEKLENRTDGISYLDKDLENLSKAAKEYIKHTEKLGEKKMNQSRTTRKAAAEDIRKALSMFTTDKERESARTRFEGGVYAEVKAEREADPEMQLFTKGITRTDGLEKSMKDKTGAEKELLNLMVTARQELANQSGREVPNAEIVHNQVSEVIAAQMLLNQKDALDQKLASDPEAVNKAFASTKAMIASDQEMMKTTQQMNGHDINEFLAGPGEKTVMKDFIQSKSDRIIAGRSEEKAREMLGKAPEQKRAKEAEKSAPVMEGPSLKN